MIDTFTQHLADKTGACAAVSVTLRWNPRRRTRAAFHFRPNGSVLVDAPPSVSVDEVRRLLRTNARWILERRRETGRNVAWFPEDYVDGVVLPYRGRSLLLRLADGGDVVLRDGELFVPATAAKERVWAWYARQADAVLAKAVADAASRLTWLASTPPWRHRYMTSRWGSFSSRGRMSLNTHLVKLSDALVEYVAMHELCHAKHLNHGKGFQRLLDAALPEWRERRTILHEHSGLLAEPAPSSRRVSLMR